MTQHFDRRPAAVWHERFRVRTIQLAVPAADSPDCGVVLQTAADGTSQLFTWAPFSGAVQQISAHPGGILEAWLTPDGTTVFYHHDTHGDEHGHLYGLPLDGGPAFDLTPDLPAYAVRGVTIAGDGSRLAFVAITAAGFQLYICDLRQRTAPTLIHQTTFEIWEPVLTYDGGLVACKSTERAGGVRDYAVEVFTTGGTHVAGCWDGSGASVIPAAFAPHAGDARLLALTSREGFFRPFLWDPLSDERRELRLSAIVGDVYAFGWSPDGTRVLLGQIYRAQQQLYTYDLRDDTWTRLDHPAGTYYNWDPYYPIWATDAEIWCVWESAAHPREVLALDAHTGVKLRTMLANAAVPAGRAWRSVDIPSSEGVLVQGWLATPEGAGPFPTVIEFHGGPHWVRNDVYDPIAQTLLEQGYAFLALNVRGSLTFGHAYAAAIRGDLGRLELDDMVAARAWLVDEGIARPDAIFLHGASYGGYLTLWGLGRRPDLWAGGMALMPVADWTANYAAAAPVMQAAMASWFGGGPETRAAQYRASSPITYAGDIAAPVQIMHPQNDTRTAPEQAAAYAERLRELGKDVELIWIFGGHMLLSEAQQITAMEHMLRFLERVLKP